MINKKTIQKTSVCIALVMLIAVLAIFGVATVTMQNTFTETAYADPGTEHTHDGYTAWESDNSLPSSPGSYYLTKDVTISGTWWAPVGETNLCLNGHGITMTGSGSVIWAKDYKQKVLNLYDCGSTVHYYDVDENDMAININETAGVGRKSFTGGYIAGGVRTDSYGGAIWVEVATFNMYGGTILGNQAGIGGGVYVSTQGTFNMYGGTIMHNKATGTPSYLFAGGGVQLFEGCTFNMYGGDISYNYSAKNGGGVAFSNNVDHFTMSGGTISHNNAVTNGGGVYKPYSYSKFYLSGNPVIGDNTANSANNNVYLNNTSKDVLTLSSALTEGASVGVTLYSGSGVFTDGWSDSMDSANPAIYFVPDNDMYDISLDSGEAKLAAHIHNDITFTAWESNNSLPTAAGNYYLTQDVVLSGSHYFSNNVSLCLNGHSITNNGEGAVLVTQFSDSLTFNLYDCDDTEHKYCIHDYLAVVDDSLTENYETFKGGYITGGKNGAVDNYATFNMYGGTLIGNTGSSPAVGSMKVFRMYGGAIIGNYATGMGAAGVGAGNSNQDASHIYLYGGKIIENTSAGYGGGVMPGLYTYSKYVVGSLEGHEALIVRDNYALKGTYNQDYYHESNVFVWRSSDHPLITMEFQNSAVTPEIGITIDDTVPGRVFASGEDYPDYYSDSWINYFFSDDLDYEAAINTDSEDYYLDFYLKALPPHVHDFDCSAEGATLTLVCKNTDRRCGLENCTITLTLVAPTLTQQGGEGSEEATISGLNVYSSATNGKTIYVDYYRTGYTGKLDYVPNTQGNYTAKITLGGATASLDYEIAAPVERLYVADVDMFTVAGGVVNAQTDGVVGSLSGSATLTYGETENDLILTLNNFVYVGSGHVEEVFWAERSSAIWASFFTEKTLKIVFDGQNSITYSDFGMLFLSESNLDVSFEGTGSFHMEGQEYGCAIFFKTADSELDINSGSYDIISGYVFDGTLHRMNVNGGTFHAVAEDGSVLSTQSFTMTDGVFDVEATKEEMSFAIRGACSIQGGEFTVRAHRHQEYAISAMGLYGSLTVTGGVVNISGEDVGVELYDRMNGSLNVSGGVVTIQGDVYGCDGYEGAPALISGGEITIVGGTSAVSEGVLLKNTVTGLGWTNVDATEGEEAIYIADEQGQTINAELKNLQLPKTLHNHVLTYTASGATITATCSADECPLTDKTASLTINTPAGSLVYDGTAKVATLSSYDASVFAPEAIKYYKGDQEVASCIDAGTYVAKVTSNGKTAEVEFVIAKADLAESDYTIPTGLEAVYGDDLADVDLPEGWAWVTPSDKVGNVGNRQHNATFTSEDSVNYNGVTKQLTVVVAKAIPDYTVPTGLTSLVDKTLDTVALSAGWTWNAPETNVGDEVGAKTFKATFTPEDTDNYEIVENVDVTVNVSTHAHAFAYAANGATLTASCGNDGCYITEGLTLTLVAPIGDLVYNGKARAATIAEGYNAEAFPNAAIVYYKGDTIVTSCVAAGTYTAKVTFGEATAQITFTIENWAINDPDQQDVKVEIKGAESDEDVRLKVEVKAEIATEEATGDYTEAVKDKIAENETVAIVYEVKLLRLTVVGGVETLVEIQPSDIKEGTTLSIAMKIPEELKGKAFRVLHIHNSGDVSEVEYTVSANGEYINVETDRLSEFAFLVEKTTDGGNGTVSTRHGFCVGWIVFIFVMLELLYLALYVLLRLPKAAFIVKKCKLSALDDFRKDHILFGCVDLFHFIGLCFSGAVFIFAIVALCVHVCPVTIVCFVFALLILAAFLFLFIFDNKERCAACVKKKEAPAAKKAEETVATEVEDRDEPKQKSIEKEEAEPNVGVTLKESLAAGKATITHMDRTKKSIADMLKSEFGKSVEINSRGNKTKTGLPLADTHYVVKGEEKTCFIYVYEVGTVVILVRLADEYATELMKKHPSVKRSAFPKAPNAWYSVILNDEFSDDEVKRILGFAYNSISD